MAEQPRVDRLMELANIGDMEGLRSALSELVEQNEKLSKECEAKRDAASDWLFTQRQLNEAEDRIRLLEQERDLW